MSKPKSAIIAGIIILIVFLSWLWTKSGQVDWAALDKQITYYYGENCSHCKRVDQFLQDNQIEDKVSFVRKESQGSIANGRELLAVAKKCGIADDQVGVPLVYAGGKCYGGETEVTNFFRSQAGISQ